MMMMNKAKQWTIPAALVVLSLIFATQVWSQTPRSVYAAEKYQSNQGYSFEFYMLMNQPGPLWLPGINLSGADLSLVDLQEAHLKEANLSGADLLLADLSSAGLFAADLSRATLDNTTLANANLSSANLNGATLTNVDLSNASLFNADLSGARLDSVTFISANLLAADLSDTDLSTANLIGAFYDEATVWPEGFDPESSGALLISSAGDDADSAESTDAPSE